MSNQAKAKKPLTFFTLPWPLFLVITVVTLLATYLGVLPKGMAGCFLFMMVLGEILGWIGDHTPIIKAAVPSCASSAPACWCTLASFPTRI